MAKYQIAVIGSGPAGLSAAARAAQRDLENSPGQAPSHILLESFELHAKTIQQYQKGKHVMAEPGYLHLRSDCDFKESKREEILGSWEQSVKDLSINASFGAEVTAITGSKGDFTISLSNDETVTAETVILAIGLQGNPRRVGTPGSENPLVQYQLDDPEEYSGEQILVIGAGDAAIENALGLAVQNNVTILNRKDEFSRAKDGNLNAVLRAIVDDKVTLDCLYSASVKEMRQLSDTELEVVLNTPEGEVTRLVNRVIARLGAIPPRRFIESIGIEFPSDSVEALPDLDGTYQSNVEGVYIVGALAGYPLIKQAMNQGYDVVEFINGNIVEPADQPLLERRFAFLPFGLDVNQSLERLQSRIPMFSEMNALQFRELLIESRMIVSYTEGRELKDIETKRENALRLDEQNKSDTGHFYTDIVREGEVIYSEGQFGTSFYTIVSGEVLTSKILEDGYEVNSTLSRGQFFGEMSLLSGHPRLENAVAGAGCIIIETPRKTMLKLIGSNPAIAKGVSLVFSARELQRNFAPRSEISVLADMAGQLDRLSLKAGEIIYDEGDRDEALYLVQSGGVTLSKTVDGRKVFVHQARAGTMIGQLGLLSDSTRMESAHATVQSELLKVDKESFERLVQLDEASIASLQGDVSRQLAGYTNMEVRPEAGAAIDFLLEQGLGEATNTLIIDEALCIGCDNCEKACAETHGGISRLDRKKGPTYANLHIPTACRHCEQPHCMKDCPPNAIRRANSGEVFINSDCIGCGNCESNCPYGVINMRYPAEPKPGLLSWIAFGLGSGPGENKNTNGKSKSGDSKKIATKCDACVDLPQGPACQQSCPTGAAVRVTPSQYFALVEEKQR